MPSEISKTVPCRSLSGLEQLALVGATGLSAHHCAQVAEKLPQLQHVDLSNSDVEDNALICLLRPLLQLRTISLKGCALLTDACAQALAKLPQLHALNLARTSVGDLGLSLLKTLEKLQKLSLCGTKVTDTSLKVINTSMRTLTELDLSCKRVTDLGLQQLCNLSKLTALNLSYTQVSDEGMMALRKLPKLSNLSLRWTRISDWALGTLTNSPEAFQAKLASPQSSKSPESPSIAFSQSGSHESLPLRRSKSSLDALSPAAQRRHEQRAKKKGLSRSGDYSQVLRRCRATMDFNSFAADGAVDEIGANEMQTPTLLPPGVTTAANTTATAPPKNPSLDLLSCRSSMCLVDQDDDCNWLNDSLSPFEIEHEAPHYPTVQFDDIEGEMFLSSCIDEIELESPQYRCVDALDFPDAEDLGWNPDDMNRTSDVTLQEMRTLDLSVTDIADTGLSFLSAFSKITSLNLFSTKVTDDGLKHVAKLDSLTDLDLCGIEVSDAGLNCLATLKSLEILKLCGNKRITDDGAIEVLTALAALQCLELRSTSVSDEFLQQVITILGQRAKLLMA